MNDLDQRIEHFGTAKAAADRLAQVNLGEVAKPLTLSFGVDLVGATKKLLSEELYQDAVQVLGQALSNKAAVVWACLATRHEALFSQPNASSRMSRSLMSVPSEELGLPPEEEAALIAAESWVFHPSDDLCQEALVAAQAGGVASPAACAALSVFYTAGSISIPGQPVVPPPGHVCGVVASGCVQLAAVRNFPDRSLELLAMYIHHGLEIADGSFPWPSAE